VFSVCFICCKTSRPWQSGRWRSGIIRSGCMSLPLPVLRWWIHKRVPWIGLTEISP
jgi:hypothetical protein